MTTRRRKQVAAEVAAEEFHSRLRRLVHEVEGLQADAQKAGFIGLTGNVNMALSYLMASEKALRGSY